MRSDAFRQALRECRSCFRPRVTGRAMTDYVCKKCGKEKTHHDTAVPEVCEECSREHNICRRCGDRLEDHA